MFLLSFRHKRSDSRGPARCIWVVRRAVQPFSSELTRLVSLAETVVRPSSRRVRLLALCSRRCRRLALWRTIFPVPVRRNRFDAPLWVLVLGICFRSSVPSVSVRRWFGVAVGCGLGRGTTGVLGRTSTRLCAAVRCQHHRHVASVLLGRRLDESVVGDVAAQALQQPVTQLGSRLLTSAEHDGHLDFRSRLQEPDHVTLFGLVVVIVDLGAQFLFFDNGLLLVLARLARLLRRLILELAVIHDLADRWSGLRRNLDKVEIGIRGDAKGIFDTHDAYLFPSWTDQTDFRYADALVDAGLSADGASLIDLSSIATATCSVGSQRVGVPRHQQKSPA